MMAAVKKGALTSLIHIRNLVEMNEMISLTEMFCSVDADNMFSFLIGLLSIPETTKDWVRGL
jgi:hypothetical protein